MKHNLFVWTAILPWALTNVHSANATDFGPLLVRPQAPLQSNGVTTRLRDASSARGGEVFVSTSAASIWAQSETYTLDYYQKDLFGGFQFSINPSLKAELSYVYRYASNSHLDSLTIFFHDMIGMSQNGREDVDKHRFYIDGPGYTIEDFSGETLGSAWELYVEQVLLENSANALSVGGTLYYNYVDDGPFQMASLEQALQLNYTGRVGRDHSIYLMGSVTHRSPEDFSYIELKEWTFNGGIGFQYKPTFNHAFLMEYRVHEGEAKNSGDLSEPAHEITLGYRFHFWSSAVEVAMVENLINMDNSADIAFTASLRHKF